MFSKMGDPSKYQDLITWDIDVKYRLYHLSLLASLSHSISSRISLTLTGPFTFLTSVLPRSFPEVRTTLTCVIPPLDPVLPKRAVTLAFTGSAYIVVKIR